MNIWHISIQNIKSKPLYTFLSIFILSLSIALLLGIHQLKISFQHQLDNNLGKIDLVVGAKGSPLQLILASLLHLDHPTGNISYDEAKKIGNHPVIKSAIPISYGDNFKGYRIVGTTSEYTSLYNAKLMQGRLAKKSMEVVLGSTVAQKLSLHVGDALLSSHGLLENRIDIHSDSLTVVGILKPTQKVIDRLIVTPLESVWEVHDHENEASKTHEKHLDHKHHNEDQSHQHHDAHEDHEEEKEITSLLITFKSPRPLLTFPRKINKQTNLQAALPRYELTKLYEQTSIGFQTISVIAYLILFISCMTIFTSIYKMIKERAFDLAILRTYGATNFQLIKMMIYEGLLIIFIAFMLGIILIKIGFYAMHYCIESDYQKSIFQEVTFQDIFQVGVLILMMVILSILLAIYPITKMNISTILSHDK